MLLKGTVTIRAPRSRVWEYLTDPQQVSQCAPGIESVEVTEPGRTFRAVASVGFGSVKVRFAGNVEWLELAAPDRAKMKAHGTAPGSAADVVSEMKLSDGADGATQLDWTADVSIVGQLASLAARLMGPVSQKLTGVFFDCVRQKIEAGERPDDGAAASGAAAPGGAAEPGGAAPGGAAA